MSGQLGIEALRTIVPERLPQDVAILPGTFSIDQHEYRPMGTSIEGILAYIDPPQRLAGQERPSPLFVRAFSAYRNQPQIEGFELQWPDEMIDEAMVRGNRITAGGITVGFGERPPRFVVVWAEYYSASTGKRVSMPYVMKLSDDDQGVLMKSKGWIVPHPINNRYYQEIPGYFIVSPGLEVSEEINGNIVLTRLNMGGNPI